MLTRRDNDGSPSRRYVTTREQQPAVLVSAVATGRPRGSSEWVAFVWSSVPGALLATAAASGAVSERIALGLFAISFVGLNLMHMGATWARVYVRPGWQLPHRGEQRVG